MQANPFEEWQRLTEHYREKSEEELRELAADFADLTETAQQVLRNEMRKRGLDDPAARGRSAKNVGTARASAMAQHRRSRRGPQIMINDPEAMKRTDSAA